MRNKIYLFTFTFLLLIIIIVLNYSLHLFSPVNELQVKIFCAGSVKIPLEKFSEIVESSYSFKVMIESGGSVEIIRKITDLGKNCDLVVIADYRLIPLFLYPNYTDWYIAFASNKIVLAYTDNSKFSDELADNPDAWFKILMKPDVRFGFSDPNKDPCGYRAVGVIALASLFYENSSILNDLIVKRTNIIVECGNGSLNLYVPSAFKVKSKDLIIRSKSVDLVALLEAGSIDYVFEYKSVAVQRGLKFLELPSQIDLSNPLYDDFYSHVSLIILWGSSGEHKIPMKSIIYGLTIPKNSENYKCAVDFLKVLLGDEGRRLFESLGQSFLDEPLGFGNIPAELRGLVKIDKG